MQRGMQTRLRQFFLTDPIAYPSRGILHTPRCIPLPANYVELFHHTKDNKKVRYAKSSCVLCIRHDDDDEDHGVRRANTARALARWRRLGASHEATDTLHRAMCLAPY